MHRMHLNSGPFNEIKSGAKTIELRLRDEKREDIFLGDTIEFSERENETNRITAKVTCLMRYGTFEELVNGLPLEVITSRHKSKKELLESIYETYSRAEEKKYGVLGIKIQIK